MNIQTGYTNQLKFTNTEAVKRSEPAHSETQDIPKKNTPKITYNWKTISAIAGGAALILLGILNRKSISKTVKQLFAHKPQGPKLNTINSGHTGKKKYIKPEIKITEKPVEIPQSEITTSYEPERLFQNLRREPKSAPKQIFLDESGRVIRGKSSPKTDRYYTRRPDINPSDVTDRVVDFAVMDELINQGKGVRSAFEHIKEPFSKSRVNPFEEDIATRTVGEDFSQVTDLGNIFEESAEQSSGFFDGMSDVFDGMTESMSDFASSIGDTLSDIV